MMAHAKGGSEKTRPQILISRDIAFDNILERPVSESIYEEYRQMRKDPTIALARRFVTAAVLTSMWSYEEKEGAPEGARDFIEEEFTPLRTHIQKMSFYGCIDFGWQSFEKVFRIRESDGRVGLLKLKPLLQDLTEILVDKQTGAFMGLFQDVIDEHDAVTLRLQESLLVNIDVEGTDWYGQSMLEIARQTQRDWDTLNKANKRYDAKIAGSHWVIHYPIGTSRLNGVETDNLIIAKSLIATLEASGAIAVPKHVDAITGELNKDTPDAWKIELLSDIGNTVTQFNERFKYLDALKVRALGLPERAVLEGQFGTKAEAEAHADFAIVNMEMNHTIIVQQINWHAVNQLLRLNFGKEAENTVFIKPTPITDLALQLLRDVYKSILANDEGMAAEIDLIDRDALRERIDVPTVPEDQQVDEPTIDPTEEEGDL